MVGYAPMSRGRLSFPGPTNIRKTQRLWIEKREQQEFAIGKGRSVLLSLRNTVAANIYNLFHQQIVEKEFSHSTFNCHAAAAIAFGESKKIEWAAAHYRGELMSVEEALAELILPCGMQIHDSDECREVVHSAVLLGAASDGTPLAFHKDGNLPMEFCNVHEIVAWYRTLHRYYGPITFYAPEPRVT